MIIKKLFVTALLSSLAMVSFAQTSAAPTRGGATAHPSHKKAASATKARPAHHKPKHVKKHRSAHQHAKKKVHTPRADSKRNKSGNAGPGLQAY